MTQLKDLVGRTAIYRVPGTELKIHVRIVDFRTIAEWEVMITPLDGSGFEWVAVRKLVLGNTATT